MDSGGRDFFRQMQLTAVSGFLQGKVTSRGNVKLEVNCWGDVGGFRDNFGEK